MPNPSLTSPNTFPLFDSHCHFDFAAFDADRDCVWQACRENAITHLLIPGVCPEQWRHARNIAETYSSLFYAVGIHPWWIEKLTHEECENALTIQTLLEYFIADSKLNSACRAIGETGLDACISTPLTQQIPLLEQHFSLAQHFNAPIILHSRKTHNEILSLIKQFALTSGGVIHGFSGSYELAKRYWDHGFHLGIGGTITYERAKKTRDAVKKMPLASLVLETDAPDMPIAGQQGQRNSPQYLRKIFDVLCELKTENKTPNNPVDIAQVLFENTQKLFQLTGK